MGPPDLLIHLPGRMRKGSTVTGRQHHKIIVSSKMSVHVHHRHAMHLLIAQTARYITRCIQMWFRIRVMMFRPQTMPQRLVTTNKQTSHCSSTHRTGLRTLGCGSYELAIVNKKRHIWVLPSESEATHLRERKPIRCISFCSQMPPKACAPDEKGNIIFSVKAQFHTTGLERD